MKVAYILGKLYSSGAETILLSVFPDKKDINFDFFVNIVTMLLK